MEKELVFRTENLDLFWNKYHLRKVKYRKDNGSRIKVDEVFYDTITDFEECNRVLKTNSWQVKGKGKTEKGHYRIRVIEPQNRCSQYCIIEVTEISKNDEKRSQKRMYKIRR